MTKTIDQMAREAGIEEFRTSRDEQTAKIAVTYYKYGAMVVVHEIESILQYNEGDERPWLLRGNHLYNELMRKIKDLKGE